MKKDTRKIKLTESKLLTLIQEMVNKAIAKEKGGWIMEFNQKHGKLLKENHMETYNVEFWFQFNDDYDYDILSVEASSPEEAIEMVKIQGGKNTNGHHDKPPRGAKNFKVV